MRPRLTGEVSLLGVMLGVVGMDDCPTLTGSLPTVTLNLLGNLIEFNRISVILSSLISDELMGFVDVSQLIMNSNFYLD